jgi:hypothetical protein
VVSASQARPEQDGTVIAYRSGAKGELGMRSLPLPRFPFSLSHPSIALVRVEEGIAKEKHENHRHT